MKAEQSAGQCYHTPASLDDPHGKNRVLTVAQAEEVKKAQREARGTSSKASDKVGYPENDRRCVRSLVPVQQMSVFLYSLHRRVVSKANRAGTRGFRAPEVLLKCGAQTGGALSPWFRYRC